MTLLGTLFNICLYHEEPPYWWKIGNDHYESHADIRYYLHIIMMSMKAYSAKTIKDSIHHRSFKYVCPGGVFYILKIVEQAASSPINCQDPDP